MTSKRLTYKNAAIAIALFVVASGAGYLYIESQAFNPVVKLDLPDGLSLMAVLPQTNERNQCSAASERFVAPFKQCTGCKVLSVRCRRRLDSLELAMREQKPVPHPMLVAADLRILVIGAAEKAKLACELLAKDMTAKGVKSATCVQPQASPPKS